MQPLLRESMFDVPFTANARALGARQSAAIGGHRHALRAASSGSFPNTLGTAGTSDALALKDMAGAVSINSSLDINVMRAGESIGTETRPANTALHPRIHA
jgi:hypothetical protein